MFASVSVFGLLKLAICSALFFVFAKCESFEDLIHRRRLNSLDYCQLIFVGTDWPGYDLNPGGTASLGTALNCCEFCNRQYGASVMTYIYRTDNKRCFCKNRAQQPVTCAACQGRNSFEQRPPLTCNAVYNVAMPGYTMIGSPMAGIAQPTDCCNLCEKSPNCKAWEWRRDQNYCYLKNGAPTLVYSPLSVSGALGNSV